MRPAEVIVVDHLYLVTDIFSRRIVAARVYEAENDENAAELFLEVQATEALKPGRVTLHSDNGGPMKGATLKAPSSGSASLLRLAARA